MLIYKFTSEQLENEEFVRRPKVKVNLRGSRAAMDFLALLDSGTDVTIIPKAVADFIGMDYAKTAQDKFYGFSSEPFACFKSKVTIKFLGKAKRESVKLQTVPVLVDLSGNEKDLVLGVAGIFDAFKITFAGEKIYMTKTQK